MAYTNTKSRGFLMASTNKKHPKAPDYFGSVEILPEDLTRIVQLMNAGQEFEVKLAGWKEVAKSGNPYLSLTMEINDGNRQTQGSGLPTPAGATTAAPPKFDPNTGAPLDGSGSFTPDLDDEIPF